MIRIAICDDEADSRDRMTDLLEQYRKTRGRELAAATFKSPLDLLAEMESGTRYDVLFLDIIMPGQNGIETAKEIRRFDNDMKIVFLTSSPEFAAQSYTVNAFYYQLKPFQAESIFLLLDSIFEVYIREQDSSFLLRCRDGINRVHPERIEFCEVNHRTLCIHLVSGKELESTGSLDKLEEQLAGYGYFLRCHRSYLVNLNYVEHISYRHIIMSSQKEIPVPRGKYEEIKNAFLENAFCMGGGKMEL